MKRLFILMTAGIILLAGCNKNADSSDLTARNNNGGTQAVNIQSEAASDDDKASESSSPDADIEIKEKMFIAQTNEIYLNPEDYLGKTIKYEGVFDIYNWAEEYQIDDTWDEENIVFNSVIRYGPGCCGNDGNVGFEVVWDGDYPEENEWVEVVGTLEAYDDNGFQYLRLNLLSLTVLSERGAETVTQ